MKCSGLICQKFFGYFLSLFLKQNQFLGYLADTFVYIEQLGSVIWVINSPGLCVDVPAHYSRIYSIIKILITLS